jgi:hypothetical protein
MKFLTTLLLGVALFAPPAMADVGPLGDGWPWPWGSECPFPWTDVGGKWVVKSIKGEKVYENHILVFSAEEEDPGTKLLYVEQYNKNKTLVAVGQGISEGNGRIISAIMDPERRGKRAYKIMVRSYLTQYEATSILAPGGCTKQDTVLAVTFCAPNGKKCMETSNYKLEKLRSSGRH